jgi:hypothetical protein
MLRAFFASVQEVLGRQKNSRRDLSDCCPCKAVQASLDNPSPTLPGQAGAQALLCALVR